MKGRERFLIIATVLIVGLTLGYQFFLADVIVQFTGTAAGAGPESQAKFQQYIKTLKDGKEVRLNYEAIAYTLPEQNPNQDPGRTFEDQLFELLTQRLGVQNPNNGKYFFEEIPGVNDYYFVTVEVNTSGPYEDMLDLLVEMERLGLLIESFKLNQSGSVLRGDNTVSLSVTVARLVKHDPASRKRFQKSGGRL